MAKKLTDEQVQQIVEFHTEGLNNSQIAQNVGVEKTTIGNYLKKLNLTRNYTKSLTWVNSKAKCHNCNLEKSEKDFYYTKATPTSVGYFSTRCRTCTQIQRDININNSPLKFFKIKIKRLKQRTNIDIKLTEDDLLKQYIIQKGLCFYTSSELVWGTGLGINENTLSIDQVIPGRGYVKGNFVLCTGISNRCKNDADLDFMRLWMPLWYEKIQQGYQDGILY